MASDSPTVPAGAPSRGTPQRTTGAQIQPRKPSPKKDPPKKGGGKKPPPKSDPKKAAAAKKAREEKMLREAEEARILGVVDAATDQRYGGAERILGDEVRRTTAHGKPGGTIDAAYAAYQQTVAGLQAQQAQSMRDAALQQQQVATGVAGAQAALGAGQAQATTDTAARYGMDGGAQAGQAAALAGQLGAVQGAGSQLQAATSGAIGLAQSDRLRQSRLAGVGGQLKDHARNQNEIKLLGQKQLDLEDQKGDFRTTYRAALDKAKAENDLGYAALGAKAQEAQRQYELELLGLRIREREGRAANKLGQDTLAANKADDAADNKRADEKLANDEAYQNATIEEKKRMRAIAVARERRIRLKEEREAAGDSPARGGGAAKAVAKLPPAKQSEWRQKTAKIEELAANFRNLTSGRQTFSSAHDLRKHLLNSGYSRVEVNMGQAVGLRGFLGPVNVLAAKSYFPGAIVPERFLG